MEEYELEGDLESLISDDEYFENIIKSFQTFTQCGMLTNNKGFLIKTNDGSEFQINIIKTK